MPQRRAGRSAYARDSASDFYVSGLVSCIHGSGSLFGVSLMTRLRLLFHPPMQQRPLWRKV